MRVKYRTRSTDNSPEKRNRTMKLITILFDIVTSIITEIFNLGSDLFKKQKSHDLDAKYSNNRELRLRGRDKDSGLLLDGRRYYLPEIFRHAAIIGTSGSGKSSRLLICQLLTLLKCSIIIHDPSGELAQKSRARLIAAGFDTWILNVAEPYKGDMRINPIATAIQSMSRIRKLATLIVTSTLGHNPKDRFWNISSIELITILLLTLRELPSTKHTFKHLRLLLLKLAGGDTDSIDKLVARSENAELFAMYKTFVAYDTRLQTNIIATTKASLEPFASPEVSETLSSSSISLEGLRSRPTAIFLTSKTTDEQFYRPVMSVILSQFINVLMDTLPDPKQDLPVHMLIDEASSLYIHGLDNHIVNARKYNLHFSLYIQSIQILRKMYGDGAEIILSNVYSKIFLSGQDLDTCQYLEKVAGKLHYLDGEKQIRREAMLAPAQSIRIMEMDEALLVCSNRPPYKLKLRPYYKSRKLLKLSELPQPPLRTDEEQEREGREPDHEAGN